MAGSSQEKARGVSGPGAEVGGAAPKSGAHVGALEPASTWKNVPDRRTDKRSRLGMGLRPVCSGDSEEWREQGGE